MKKLCYTEDVDFTDYQGIGSDPMYRRYESVNSVVVNNIDEKYQSMLARPNYDDGIIDWYVKEWNDVPENFKSLVGDDREKYAKIKEETLAHYYQVINKLQRYNPEDFSVLSAALKFVDDEFIYCYDDKIVLVAWGMRPDASKHLATGSWVKGLKLDEKFTVIFEEGNQGKLQKKSQKTIKRSKGYKLVSTDIPEIDVDNNYSFTGWFPNPLGLEVVEDSTITAQYDEVVYSSIPNDDVEPLLNVYFETSDKGVINGLSHIECFRNHVLADWEIPTIDAKKGYKFVGWKPKVLEPISQDTIFIADYEVEDVCYSFNSGEYGYLRGNNTINKIFGGNLLSTDCPEIQAKDGYEFIGWDVSPLGIMDSDRVFTAQYRKKTPWYKKWRVWYTESGCLKWIVNLLLLIALLALLLLFIKSCNNSRNHDTISERPSIYPDQEIIHNPRPIIDDSVNNNGIVDDSVSNDSGISNDDNRSVSIVDNNNRLPKHDVVAPIYGIGGQEPVIIHNDGRPDIIGNRLNIFFEDENADLNKWANDFKTCYPSSEYKIIGYDKNIRTILIEIPESARNKVRDELNSKISDQAFFVVDESIINARGFNNIRMNARKGWHIDAINLKNAWTISSGKSEIVVAIVDDGIDVKHDIFKGRLYKEYNVFTGNEDINPGQGHGTHVAGLAVGSNIFIDKGISGVAPKCKIMPIQVFDKDMCTFSSLAGGIMYAIHNGADVVNISIGPSFEGLNTMPISEQKSIAANEFKNEERLYNHIIQTANKKNVILVFAAGNDRILTSILPECRFDGNTVNVAAVDVNIKASVFTNYALGTNISAPGVDIYSSYLNNSFTTMSGTSMAAPIVTGAIALMRSLKPNLSVRQILGVLQQSGRDVGPGMPPMLVIDKALELVKSGDIPEGPVFSHSYEQSSPTNNQKDFSALRKMLEELMKERSKINDKINQIENQLK